MWEAFLPVISAVALLIPLLAAFGTAAVREAGPPAPSDLRPAASTTCTQVRLVVVDGSTRGVSAALAPLVRDFRSRAAAWDRQVSVDHVGVDFPTAASLAPRRQWGRRVPRVVTAPRVRTWRAEVSDTIRQTVSRLRAAVQACPDQHLALAGFGQGASVIHRLLVRLADDTVVRPRIVSAALVADPDRHRWTRGELVGEPVAPPEGRGVITWRLTSAPDVPDRGQEVRVVNVCNRADVVCDPRRTTFRHALSRYRAYTNPEGVKDVRTAGRRIANQLRLWPVPTPLDQTISVEPGTGISRQLDAGVPARMRDTVQWGDVSGLPAGVTLSSSGLLSGSTTTRGAYRVEYEVRNTSPGTAPTSGALTLVVRDTVSGGSAGGRTSCEVRDDGSAYCWGENRWGQLGDGTDVSRSTPTRVTGRQAWRQVSTGGSATCGVTQSGNLFCWGLNHRGQLGLGGGPQRWNPQRVGAGSAWESVAVGWMHACGTRSDGALFCWGADDQGQLGIGVGADRQSPVRVGRAERWKSVAVGGWHSCAVTRAGAPWCWGRNDLAQLGTGNLNRRAYPARVQTSETVVQMDASWSNTCALTAGSRALCWGMNDQGQVGDGTQNRRAYPAAVAGNHRFVSLGVGDSHACGVDLSGAAWCWGSNRYGQLGDATRTGRRTPVLVAGDRTWRSIQAGWLHTCAVTTAQGTSLCWGNNEQGQLGYGDRTDRSALPGIAPRTVAQRTVYSREVVATSFNVLGSSHTEPGGGTPGYAPGRLRSEWAVNLLASYGTDIAGFQELNLDQRRVLNRSMKGWSFYPRTADGQRAVWQTVGWDNGQWELVGARMVDVPFRGRTRPNPLVELRNRGTGDSVFVFNIHNSAGSTSDRESERDRATAIEIAEVNTERQRPIEGLLLGDFNEHDEAFCKVVGRTDLEAVNGGTYVNGTCNPPKYPRVDWMFHSPGFGLVSQGYEKSGRVKRITDHWVLTARMTVPGA